MVRLLIEKPYHTTSSYLYALARGGGFSASTGAIGKLASSFARIHQLPRLETIHLRFNPVYDNETFSDNEVCLSLQASILGALAASFSARVPSKLTTLSLLNLRVSVPHPLEIFPLQTILPTLSCLQLSAVSDWAPNPDTFRDRWGYFWSTLCPRIVPVQTQVTLTELTLHCSTLFVGVLDGLSLHELYFPHLAVLSLRNIVFSPIQGDEDFVLRHAATLTRLELLTCKVLVDSNRRPSPAPSTYINLAGDVELSLRAHWDRIWDRFAAGLTALVKLDVDERHFDGEYRYVHHRRDVGMYVVIYAVKSRNAADVEALRRFRLAVAARSMEKDELWKGEAGPDSLVYQVEQFLRAF